MLQFYRLVRQYWPYVGPFVALFALSKWLGVTVVQVEMALTSVSSYVWQAEIRWLVAAILCLYFSYTQIRNRGVPLTIVSTEVELTLLTAKGRPRHPY